MRRQAKEGRDLLLEQGLYGELGDKVGVKELCIFYGVLLFLFPRDNRSG